jgi:hypothetical protein
MTGKEKLLGKSCREDEVESQISVAETEGLAIAAWGINFLPSEMSRQIAWDSPKQYFP